MKKIIFLIVIVIFSSLESRAQSHLKCGYDEAFLNAQEKNLNLIQNQAKIEENYHKYLKHYIKSKKNKTPEVIYKIPVVIHLMHQYGSVFNDFINNRDKYKTAVDNINLHFANEDSLQLEPPFDKIAPPLNIEFVLAKLDPDGNPTEGLTLNYFPDTVSASPNANNAKVLKSISQWDNHKYLNIWIVPVIEDGFGGYALLPGAPDELDGIVMVNGPLKVPGGLNGLAHENGHWLGLKHPWGNPPNSNVSSNCNSDDDVADTPNSQGQLPTIGCGDLKRNTCVSTMPFKNIFGDTIWTIANGEIHDNVQNAMDYAFCTFENFTEGQKVLVRSTLATNPANGRDSIWREKNLIFTGICDTCGPYLLAPFAEFRAEEERACVNEGIQFTDVSYNGTPTEWLWDFGDGTTSTIRNPIHFFAKSGIFDVSLTAVNTNGLTQMVKEKAVIISAISGGGVAPFHENFESNTFPDLTDPLKQWVITNGHSSASWEKIDGIYATGGASLGLNIQDVNSFGNQSFKYSITSPIVDFSNPECNELTYKWAYVKQFSGSTDLFNVQVNKTCGKGSWTTVFSASAATMGTASSDIISNKEYKPEPSEFKEQTVSLSGFTKQDHLLIRFELETKGGNYFYIDDINIGCDTLTAIAEDRIIGKMEVYPNPYSDNATLELGLNKSERISISISNILGENLFQKEYTMSSGKHTFGVNELIGTNEKGVYFITVKSKNSYLTKKIVRF